MTRIEEMALDAKIKMINNHVYNLLRNGEKVDKYDIYRLVTPSMRRHVTVIDPNEIQLTLLDGIIQFVQRKKSVA